VDAEGRITDERADRHPVEVEPNISSILQSQIPLLRLTDAPLALKGQDIGQGMHVLAGLWDGNTAIGYLTVDNLLRQRPISDRDCEIIRLYASALGHLVSIKRAGEEIRAGEERFEKSFQSNPIATIINILPEGRMLDVNDTFLRITGYSREEVIGRTGLELNLWADPEDRIRLAAALIAQESLRDVEGRLLTKSGESRDMLASVETIQIAGQPHGLIMLVDITERKQAEQEIEALSRFPAENPNPVLRVEQDGKIMYANLASEALLRLWNCTVGEYLPPDWRERVVNAARNSTRTTVEVEHEERVYTIMIVPIPDSEYVNIYGRNITERKKAEEALRLRMEQLVALNQVSQAVATSLDLDQVLTEVMSKAGKVTSSDHASVVLVDKAGLISSGSENLPSSLSIEKRARKRGFTNWIIHSRRPAVVDEIGEAGLIRPRIGGGAPRSANPHLVAKGIKSFVGLPLMVEDRVVGVLYLHSLRPGTFHDQLTLLTTFASQAAIAIEKARLYEEAQKELTERKRAEEALGRSEERFRIAAGSVSDSVWEWDIIKSTLDWFGDIETILGYGKGEFPHTINAWEKMIHPDDHDRVMAALDRHLLTKEPYSEEYRVIKKDGSITYWMDKGTARWDKNDKAYVMVGAVTDITERKRAEETLRQSEAKYRSIFDNAAEGIFQSTPEGKFLTANSAMARILGFSSPEELICERTDIARQGYMHPEQREEFKRLLEQQNKVSEFEYEALRKDGNVAWISETTQAVRDATGRIVRYEGIFIDITARKQAEEEVRQSDEIFSQFMHHSPIYIFFKDEAIRAVRLSSNYEKMLGKPVSEMLGKTMDDLFPSDLAKRMIADDLRILKEGKPVEIEEELNGRSYSTIKFPIYDKGEVQFLAGFTTDITERKQAEEIIQQNYDAQSALNGLLQLSLEDIPLEDILKRALDLVLSIPWLALEVKGGIFLVGDEPDVLEMKAQSNLGEPIQRICARVPFGKCLCGRAAAMQKLQFSNHLDEQHEVSYEGMQPHGHYCFPILFAGRTIGVLNLYIREGHHQDQKEVEFLGAITNTLAGIIERKRAEEALSRQAGELRQRNTELARLYRASGSLISGTSLNFQELAQKIVEIVRQEFGQANCSLLILQKDSNELVRLVASGPYADQVKYQNMAIDGPGLIPLAIRTNKAVNVGDVHSAPDYVPGWEAAQSELAIPLKVGGDAIGVIDVQNSQPNAFSPDDERLMTVFAERAALALGNSRLNTQTEARLQQLMALRTVDMAISGSFDINLTLGILLDQVTGQLGVHAADILAFNATTQTFKFACERGFRTQLLHRTQLKFGAGYAWRAIRERRVIIVPDIQVEPDGLQRSPDLSGEQFVAYLGMPLIAKGQIQGILEVFHREPLVLEKEWVGFLEMLAGQAAIAIDSAELFDHLQRSNADLTIAYDSTLEGWASALELRDKETEGHTRRVTELTTQLARALGVKEADIVQIYRGALLHDIGKVGVPDSIVLKPGPLTEDEWVIMRKHPQYAYDMLSPIAYLRLALNIPYCHHEKWDGTGYPRGLKGEQIPLAARLFAVVDVYDALTSDRPYRKAWTREKAISHIREQAGSHFDPEVVKVFLNELKNEKSREFTTHP
jgi:PAS domain S-box-containing protein